jgi:hypothetical protein
MRIKATYIDDSFRVEADEQKMIIPRPFFSRFVSVVESAYHRYTRSLKEAKKAQYEELKAKIGAAGHPDILPFVEKDPGPPPEKRPQGRPKGISTPRKSRKSEPKPKEPESPPFKHTPFR